MKLASWIAETSGKVSMAHGCHFQPYGPRGPMQHEVQNAYVIDKSVLRLRPLLRYTHIENTLRPEIASRAKNLPLPPAYSIASLGSFSLATRE